MPTKSDWEDHREKERRLKLRRLSYGIFAVAFLVNIATALWTFPQLPTGAKTVGELPASTLHDLAFPAVVFFSSLFVSLIFGAVLFMWEIHARLELFTDRVTGLESSLDRVTDCRYLGVGGAALGSILERARKAQEVRNTLVLFGLPEHDVAAACYSKEQIAHIHACIADVLSKGGGSWTDIVSQEVVNSSTLNWLEGLIEKLKAKFGVDEASAKRAVALDRYTIRRLKESYPIINFMILRYENDD